MRVDAYCSCMKAKWSADGLIRASAAEQIDVMLDHWRRGHVVRVRADHYLTVVMEATKLRDLRIRLGDNALSLNLNTRMVTLRDGSVVPEEVLENHPLFK